MGFNSVFKGLTIEAKIQADIQPNSTKAAQSITLLAAPPTPPSRMTVKLVIMIPEILKVSYKLLVSDTRKPEKTAQFNA